MAVNMQTKFVAVLEARGFAVVKRGKYIVMGKESFKTKTGKPGFLYVGKSGSLRAGGNQASSRPLSDRHKSAILGAYNNLMPPGF